MLSNRITAKSLELNPANQARKRMVNESKDCHPAGCVSPPDRPPLPPPPPAAPGRLFPCTELPALVDALCLPSLAVWCSAISAHGVGWICSSVPPACHAPVSPSAPSCRKPLLRLQPVAFGILCLPSPPGRFLFTSYSEGQPLHPKRTLMRHIASSQHSIRYTIERRWRGQGWDGRGYRKRCQPVTERQVREGGATVRRANRKAALDG